MDFSMIDGILEAYRARGYFPGAVCHVFDAHKTLYRTAVGGVADDALFDLASVSKIICTTMILSLADEGKLDLDAPAAAMLPGLLPLSRQRLKDVPIHRLMTHTSGLVPWYPFYADGRDFFVVLEHVLSDTPVQTGMAYSDLNFMLLGKIFSSVSGLTLREGLERYIKAPLSIEAMCYAPAPSSLCVPSSMGNQIEKRMCKERGLSFDGWREDGVPVCGTCNDGNAHYFFGGASGHAGVFANASALATLCRFYMNTTKPAFVRAMDTNVCGRGLGFDRSDVFPSGCGHTGFTGTSIFFSRARHIGAVILTNKFYRAQGEPPGSSNAFRREIHRLLVGEPAENPVPDP